MRRDESMTVFRNTVVMYLKIIVSTLVWLFLTREVLATLGIEDFGIYNLIAGVISILAFINSALMASTQRYLSFAIGERNILKVKAYFESGIIIHVVIATILFFLFEIVGLFAFDGFLNIPENRIESAKVVYQLMIFSTLSTVISVPYNAAINANEDLWYLGVIQIISTFLKLSVLIAFFVFSCEALIIYTIWITFAHIFELFAAYVWCRKKYQECNENSYSISQHKSSIFDMLGFSGWNTLGAFAVVCRNQGVAVLLNVFFGPIINAVFGIANQVDGQLISFANALTAATSPQIIKSQGEKNQKKLSFLSVFISFPFSNFTIK